MNKGLISIKIVKHGRKFLFPTETTITCPECKNNNDTNSDVGSYDKGTGRIWYMRLTCPVCHCTYDIEKSEKIK